MSARVLALEALRGLRLQRAFRGLRAWRALRGAFAALALVAAQGAPAATLADAIARAPDGAWLEYEVALIPGDASPCCFDWRGGHATRRGCSLDGRNWNFGTSKDHVRASDSLRVFLRKGGGMVDRVRAVGGDCPVDTGEASPQLVANVPPVESVAMLARLATAGSTEHRTEPLAALAMHADASAARELERLAGDGRTEARGDALFWLAQRGDTDAERIIRAALAPDVPTAVQKKAIFALSQLPAARAVPALREIVESDRPRTVRREALFWLAQQDDDEAFAVFDEILR